MVDTPASLAEMLSDVGDCRRQSEGASSSGRLAPTSCAGGPERLSRPAVHLAVGAATTWIGFGIGLSHFTSTVRGDVLSFLRLFGMGVVGTGDPVLGGESGGSGAGQ